RTLARRLQQTIRTQSFRRLGERLSPEAIANGIERGNGALQISALRVHRELAERDNLHAVFGERGDAPLVARPEHAPDHRRRAAKVEIPVTVTVRGEVADLASNPERRERALEHRLGERRQRLHGHCLFARRARKWRAGGHEVARVVGARRLAHRKELRLEQIDLWHRPLRRTLHRDALCSAARTVFLSSIAIVIGPTPPGTGVMRDARSRALSKSTSPTSLKPLFAVESATRLIPTSITTAPSFTMSPVTMPGFPAATMRMSARSVCALR